MFDGETWEFSLCEECLLCIIKDFEIVPKGFMVTEWDVYKEGEHQKVFNNWKATGEWEDMEYKTYEDLVEMNNSEYDLEALNDVIKQYHPDKPLLKK